MICQIAWHSIFYKYTSFAPICKKKDNKKNSIHSTPRFTNCHILFHPGAGSADVPVRINSGRDARAPR